MVKVYISQPMRGLTNEQIVTKRAGAILDITARLSGDNVEIISMPEPNPNRLIALADSLKKMATADLVYFISGWQDAAGCRIEHSCCEEYAIPYIEE